MNKSKYITMFQIYTPDGDEWLTPYYTLTSAQYMCDNYAPEGSYVFEVERMYYKVGNYV